MIKPFDGLIAATHTPMQPDGSIDLDRIDAQAQSLAENGVTGVFACGTTGEGLSLSVAERMAITKKWASIASAHKLRLIVHMTHNALEDARALASHAADQGVDGVSFMGPTFFRPANVEDLIKVCEPIASAAPSVPFFFYNIPSMTNIRVSMHDFLKEGSDTIPNLAGVKFTDMDLWELQRCLALDDGRFDLFFGSDENLLAGMALGVRGAVGSTYNYAAPIYQNMIQAYQAGDITTAQTWSRKAVALVALLKHYGVMQAGKALMTRLGVECGPVRWPLQPLTKERIDSLFKEVDALGVMGS